MDFERSAGGILLPAHQLKVGGRFKLEHWRGGDLLETDYTDNLVVNEGLDHILNTVFHGGTPVGTWYLGLFEGNYTPTSTVTAATIATAATECLSYDETSRQEYAEGASSAQSITNSANKATYTINGTKTIYGAFLVSNPTKGATSGVLMCAARFSTAKQVVASDQILLTYTFNASSV